MSLTLAEAVSRRVFCPIYLRQPHHASCSNLRQTLNIAFPLLQRRFLQAPRRCRCLFARLCFAIRRLFSSWESGMMLIRRGRPTRNTGYLASKREGTIVWKPNCSGSAEIDAEFQEARSANRGATGQGVSPCTSSSIHRTTGSLCTPASAVRVKPAENSPASSQRSATPCASIAGHSTRATRRGRNPGAHCPTSILDMKESLTLLQRGVIQRLREAGYPNIADGAHEAWTHGKRCQLPVHSLHPELAADYEKANSQATSSRAED